MQVKLVIFPAENDLHVVIWGKWTKGTMRVRQFENRTEMIATLIELRLIGQDDGDTLENFAFTDSCPLFSADVDEESLTAHGFEPA